jgi:hypothetical protein
MSATIYLMLQGYLYYIIHSNTMCGLVILFQENTKIK